MSEEEQELIIMLRESGREDAMQIAVETILLFIKGDINGKVPPESSQDTFAFSLPAQV